MVSRDAYQKLCDLIADPGSSGTRLYKLILSRLARKKKKEKSCKLQATSLTACPRDDRMKL